MHGTMTKPQAAIRSTKTLLVRLDPDLVEAIQQDAGEKGQSLTVWVARAAQAALKGKRRKAA